MSDAFDSAKIRTADGRVGFDACKLVEIPVEGIALKDYPNHKISVRTVNTTYVLTTRNGRVLGQAFQEGKEAKHLSRESEVNIHGSTWGGSMLKIGFIGVYMHLEFSIVGRAGFIHTSEIRSITVRELPNE